MSRYILTMDKPSRWWGAMWREALPTGNGQIGAAVYGAVYDETIMMTHEDLWWKGHAPDLPDVSHHLEGVRQDIMDGKPENARWSMCDALKEQGYNPAMAAPLPLCDLKIKSPLKYAFSQYKRQLNMATGEVSVYYNDGDVAMKRDVFVSRKDGVVVCRIRSSSDQVFKVQLALDFHDLEDAKTKADNIDLSSVSDMSKYLPQYKEFNYEHQYMHFSAQNEDGSDFGAVAKVIALDIEASDGYISVSGRGEVLIIVKPYVKSDRSYEKERIKKELESIASSYSRLIEAHCGLHTRLMQQSSFELFATEEGLSNEALLTQSYTDETPTELIEKLWLYGKYLLVSSSASQGQPCHMYGLWCGEYQGMWAFNMLNENVEMIYWQALSGNLPEVMLSLFDYYESMMDDFRTNAKQLFGCSGIYIPATTTPASGLIPLLLPHILYWTGGAGWLCQHYYDYYAYTGDEAFLETRALPFMKETIAFYEDFLLLDSDGYYTTIPSNSPENSPGNYWKSKGLYGQNTVMETTINATMDFAILKELLTNLLKAESILSITDGCSNKWSEMLKKIPPYQLNEDNTVKEWMHDMFEDNHHHRHLSHLYPLFPGVEVTKDNAPDLYEAYGKTMDKRFSVGLKEQSGWSIAHMANCFARVGNGDQSLNCLEILTRSCMLDNLYTTHNDWRNMGTTVDFPWAPIQMDANMGITSAMNEMVLRSTEGVIHILPALPKKWAKGKVTNLLARGAVEVSIEWDLEKKHLDVVLHASKNTQVLDLILPEVVSSCDQRPLDGCKLKKVVIMAGKSLALSFH